VVKEEVVGYQGSVEEEEEAIDRTGTALWEEKCFFCDNTNTIHWIYNSLGGQVLLLTVILFGLQFILEAGSELQSVRKFSSLSSPACSALIIILTVLCWIKVSTLPKNSFMGLQDIKDLPDTNPQGEDIEVRIHSWQTYNYACGCIADGVDRVDLTSRKLVLSKRRANWCSGAEQWTVETPITNVAISIGTYEVNYLNILDICHPSCCLGPVITIGNFPYHTYVEVAPQWQGTIRENISNQRQLLERRNSNYIAIGRQAPLQNDSSNHPSSPPPTIIMSNASDIKQK